MEDFKRPTKDNPMALAVATPPSIPDGAGGRAFDAWFIKRVVAEEDRMEIKALGLMFDLLKEAYVAGYYQGLEDDR